MALETSGFQLSQFDRAPNIPGNIGVVDTKSIYDSVTSALKQQEVFRTLQQVQGLNDASMAYQTAQAQGLLSNLPDTLAAQRAQSRLLSSESTEGLRGVTSKVDAQIAKSLLSSASDTASLPLVPDRAAAEKAKLKSEQVTSGIMAEPETARSVIMAKTMGATGATRQSAIAILENPNSSEFARRAAEMALGFTAKAAAPGIGYQVLTGPDGVTRLVATNKTAVGAQDLLTGQVLGVAPGTRPTMAPPLLMSQPLAAPAATAPTATAPTATAPTAAAPAATAPAATAPAAPAPAAPAAAAPAAAAPAAPYVLVNGVPTGSREQADSFWLGQSSGEKTSEKDISQIKSEWLKKLPALDSSIRLMELQVAADEVSLNRALEQIKENPLLSTGIGAMLFRELGGSKALDLKETLEPVRTNIFTGELSQMRANSPTGGAVGNVTDVEGTAFKAALGSLNTAQSADQLILNIEKVREARKRAVENLKRTMSDYRGYLNGYGATPAKSEPSVDEILNLYK